MAFFEKIVLPGVIREIFENFLHAVTSPRNPKNPKYSKNSNIFIIFGNALWKFLNSSFFLIHRGYELIKHLIELSDIL